MVEYGIVRVDQPLRLSLLLKRLSIRVNRNHLAARQFRPLPSMALHFPLFFRSLSKLSGLRAA
jgi:hypothetical protein